MFLEWPAPLPDGGTSMEMALSTARKANPDLLIIPPLFDEANRVRAQLVLLMRTLQDLGVTSVMPDLPGTNESLQPQAAQTLSAWRAAVTSATEHFGVSRALFVRSACTLDTGAVPAFHYASHDPAKLLRAMARAQSLAEKEAGNHRSPSEILDGARASGGIIAGWQIGPAMAQQLCETQTDQSDGVTPIAHEEIGGRALWLSSEGGIDEKQAKALAAVIAQEAGAP